MVRAAVRYLLDSVIVIDHFNDIAAASEFLENFGLEAALSAITRAEVLTGFDSATEPLALELLNVWPTLPITFEIADRAARLRRATRWKLPDAMQAAVAIQHDLVLVTRDTRDFTTASPVAALTPYEL